MNLDSKQLIFSGTASKKGRHISVTPGNSTLSHLAYGRIRLDAEVPRVAFETGGRETAFICMKGACRLTVNGEVFDLDTHDGAYIPRGKSVEVSTTSEVDLVECSADVDGDYPLQIVRYAQVKQDP